MTNDLANGRRRRRGLLLGALALATLLLGACSAGGGGTSAADSESGGDAGAVVEEAVEAADRSVIVEGSMSLVVDDVARAVDAAEAFVADVEGRIDGRDERVEEYDDQQVSVATLVLRIPADSLDDVLDDLRGIGDVESLDTSSIDVTDSMQDTAARIASLESTIVRLQAFQDQAASVDDLLSIEAEISDRRSELEGLQARQKADQERVALSTLTLTIRSFAAADPSGPANFWEGLVIGWNGLVGFVAGFVVVLGMLLPWLALMAIIAAIVIVVARWARRRRPPKPQPTPAQAPQTWVGAPYGADPYPSSSTASTPPSPAPAPGEPSPPA